MPKVPQIANGDTGKQAREAYNQALKSVDSTDFDTGAFIDDDTFATASSTSVASSESIKAYIDSQLTNMANDPLLEIALGNVAGQSAVNKFGRTTNADSGILTDIWDRANTTDDQDIWVAPTQARTHQIVSSSASDDGDPAGVGARTIQLYGLTDWDTAEVSETITMNGTSNVATANQYVIIHRMKVLTKGATSSNVGTITATADTDGTVTAQINAGEGQTQMAIYGIPSISTGYMTGWYSSTNGSVNVDADVEIVYNPEPDAQLTNFLTKETNSIRGSGSSFIYHPFAPYKSFPGPGILKIQATSDTANSDISGGFDMILVDSTIT